MKAPGHVAMNPSRWCASKQCTERAVSLGSVSTGMLTCHGPTATCSAQPGTSRFLPQGDTKRLRHIWHLQYPSFLLSLDIES